jgi:exoribonuclease R
LDIGEDSHKWIEYAMLEYNKEAALVLRGGSKGLLRSHAGTTKEDWTDLAAKTGCPELAWFGYAAGKYVEATAEDIRHAGLSMDCYCHASSPLRRYADLVNQRWLKHLLFGDSAPQYAVHPMYLNERGRIAKQLDRDLWFLAHLRPDTITAVQGFVLKEKTEGRWSVYVPEWRRKITGKISTEERPELGALVEVRAYTNLKSPHYDQRLVCSLTPIDH